MAINVAPKGLVPVRHMNGSAYNGQFQHMLVDSGDATAVYVGDLVIEAGSAGLAGGKVAGQDTEGMMTVIDATAGTSGQDIVGVVVGFLPDPTNLIGKYRLASTSRIAMVCTDMTVVYEVQEDAVTTPIVAASIGLNVPYNASSGSATTGVSNTSIISASVATTATLPLKIVGLSKRVGNAFYTAGNNNAAYFDVIINTGFFMPNIAGK